MSDAGPRLALTVLLHKPAGLTAAAALQTAWAALDAGPAPPRGLQEALALPVQASGLAVWSNEPGVLRRLRERQRPLETEWLLTLPIAVAEPVIAALQGGGLRVSLGHAREGTGQWRLADKGDPGVSLVDYLGRQPLAGAWRLHRQRIGRIGLPPLPCGQARWRRDFEKF